MKLHVGVTNSNQKQYFRYDLHSVPKELIKSLGWNGGERLRPYVKGNILILEKSEGKGMMTLVKFKDKSIRYKIHLPRIIVESLGWNNKEQCLGISYNGKMIIVKTRNKFHPKGISYYLEKIATRKSLLPNVLEWYE
jgi:hypothetical protein